MERPYKDSVCSNDVNSIRRMMSLDSIPSQTLGQYDLLELIGVGGMGAVYRAYQRNLEREVAFKVLTLSLAADPDYIKRFYREAKTAGSLEHPHIVPIYDFGSHENTSFIVMRLLGGGSMSQRMKQRSDVPISLGEAAKFLRHLAGALEYAHKHNIVHRDIKANNIMFDTHGSPYLVDFGLAKILEDSGSMTTSAATMGTPGYMAPEQWRGEPCTPLTDQYALAVTLFELITGSLPFKSPSLYTLMTMHINENPPPLDTLREDTPTRVTQALHRALLKDPKLRYPSVMAFAQAFAASVRGIEGKSSKFFTFPLNPKDPIQIASTPSPFTAEAQLLKNLTIMVSEERANPEYAGHIWHALTSHKFSFWIILLVTLLLAVTLLIWQLQGGQGLFVGNVTPPIVSTPFEDGIHVGIINSSDSTNVRDGAGINFKAIRILQPRTRIEILGQNDDGTWYHIQLPDGTQGWVFAELVDVITTPEPSETP